MLRAIYKTGSSVILPYSKDIDLIYYYDTNAERLEALKNYKRNNSEDVHFRVIQEATGTNVFLGCYIRHYMEWIEGEHIEELQNFSIFDEKIKEEYIQCLKKYYNLLPDGHKKWYHIVIAYYLYKRGEYNLTKSELDIAQLVHNRGITPELKKEIGEWLL